MNLAWLGSFYLWFWYHSEFWLTRNNRRPYTFIMRDWIYTHACLSGWAMIAWFVGMIALADYSGVISTVLSILSGLLCAHLIWGAKWIEGQMDLTGLLKEEKE